MPVGRVVSKALGATLKAPIYFYRWTLKPYVGWQCRHLPTCSEYSLEAIDKNGPWRGFWLTVSRLSRCRPWGTSGYDAVPDIRSERHWIKPWRYGRWTRRSVERDNGKKNDSI
ncbi:MAG: membrane protein insertion efficiency factor YidD [Filomicrobium sp.]